MDELNSLPYLDAVVREVLRLHAPVGSTIRMANKDDVLPLSTPVKGKDGRLLEGIPCVMIYSQFSTSDNGLRPSQS